MSQRAIRLPMAELTSTAVFLNKTVNGIRNLACPPLDKPPGLGMASPHRSAAYKHTNTQHTHYLTMYTNDVKRSTTAKSEAEEYNSVKPTSLPSTLGLILQLSSRFLLDGTTARRALKGSVGADALICRYSTALPILN